MFHAVFEATKGLAERLRQLGGSQLDGAALVDYCFAVKTGSLRINAFRTETEISEHTGFANLLKGVFGTFRNPPAHTPRATAGWTITEPDALDLFSTLSLLHRRLDSATTVSRP
ncbi:MULTISPECIES: TIGR02391 family protein [unclassified Frankia]|uniref:TIGR02391 family protein n=1 Tax=Frankia sp. CgS1 TaxID=1745381 RepID=UPI00210159F8|nr:MULTISPECIES: TIGR02391 family protein [unclassified Frankia]